jgi:hypothetical protein
MECVSVTSGRRRLTLPVAAVAKIPATTESDPKSGDLGYIARW